MAWRLFKANVQDASCLSLDEAMRRENRRMIEAARGVEHRSILHALGTR